jgi:hypothetical protein
MNSYNVSFLSSINQFHEFIWIMRSTITVPRRSRQNAGIDAKAAPAPSSLPSRCYSPSKTDTPGGEATIPPSVPSITLAAVNAANAAAVPAANPWRSIEFPLAPIADVSEPVSSTLPAGVATFSVSNIMPTAVLASTAKFAWPEALAADVSVPPAAAYSTLGVTTMARAEAASTDVTVATAASAKLSTAEAASADLTVCVDTAARAEAASADVTVATAASANLSTAEAVAADLPVPLDSAARAEAASADVTVATAASPNPSMAEAAAADLPVPVNPAALSSAGMAIAEAATGEVCFKNAASANLATAEAVVTDLRGECVGLILHQFIYDINWYYKWIHALTFVLNQFIY